MGEICQLNRAELSFVNNCTFRISEIVFFSTLVLLTKSKLESTTEIQDYGQLHDF